MDEDAQFFADHPDRYAHIREPRRVLHTDKQRATRYVNESEGEFWSLGEHNKDRRRILLWRVPHDHPMYDPAKPQILKLPMLAFADETIEDRDDILLPIIDGIMKDAAKKYAR